MIWQRFFRPCTAIVFLCGFAQAGFAASVNLSLPAAGWAVGPISAKSDSGISYCSMKNTYQNGQMLVFARDGEGANSIALDFRKDQLEIGRQYEVTIHVGAVTRRMSALAATRQVMIMQMGTDTAFYNALRHKSSIVFNLEKKGYGFNLDTSVTDALNALNDCSDSFQSGGKFVPMAVPLKKGKVSDVVLQAEELTTEPPASPKPRTHQDTAAKSAPEPAPDQGLQADVEKLRAENKKLSLENQETRQTLLDHKDNTDKAAEKAARQENLQTELNQLKTENEKLAQETQSKQDAIKAEIARLKAENEKLAQATRVDQDEIKAETQRLKGAHEKLAEQAPAVRAAPEQPSTGKMAGLKNLLEASRVVPAEALRTETSPGTYRWTFNDMYGSAQAMSWVSGKSFGEMANSYIKQASSLCRGAFAQKTGMVKKAGKLNVLESEMTCLDGQNDAAAAVLFVADDGKFSVITQEGTVDQLTTAMSNRDSIISAASGKQVD